MKLTRKSKRALLAGAVVALVATTITTGQVTSAFAAKSTPDRSSPKPTIVLVHGGFADATNSWSPVIRLLEHDGYPVMAPANPLRSIPTDAAYLRSVLKSIHGPVVLVGHSYGGAVITNAAAGLAKVKALVYVAAFVPDVGEQLGQLIGKFPGSIIQAATYQVPFPAADGTTGIDLYLQPNRLRAVFAADLSASQTQEMAAEQRPFSAECFVDPTTAAAWHTIPSWGVVAGADKAIPAALEKWEYNRAGSHYIVVPGASHVVMISHPSVVTGLIEKAAKATT